MFDEDEIYELRLLASKRYSQNEYSCRDRMCGASDCSTCYGDAARDYMTPCAVCDEENIEHCTCEEYVRLEAS